MARTVKEQEYVERRNEILDMAQQFVYSKGYEQMTIQDILDGLQISKGAFYHYFDSKQALMEALVERIMEAAEQVVLPIVQDTGLSAHEKFQRFFAAISRWKTDRKAFFLPFLRGWYADDNAIVRQKVAAMGYRRVGPLLSRIIQQGVQEGTLNTSYPEHIGELMLSLIWNLGEIFARWLFAHEPGCDDLGGDIENIIAAHIDAIERVLGAAPGSLQLVDMDTLKDWVVSWDDYESKQSVTEPLNTIQVVR